MPAREQFGADELRALVRRYQEALHEHRAALDRLNVFPVPDGDTGTNMARTLDAVVEALPPDGSDLATTCRAVADAALLGARGNSGVILSQVLRGLTGALPGDGLAAALAAAATAARRAVLEPVEGTMLTVADAAAGASPGEGASPVDVLEAARAAAAEALARTPEQLPALADAGVVDAGGAGFLLLLDAALAVVDGRPVPAPPAGAPVRPVAHTGPRFEVMYLLEAPEAAVDPLRARLGDLGDSVAVSGGEGRWSCHVHTDDPDAAVAAGHDAGAASRVEVVDLTRSGLQDPPEGGGSCRPEA